MSCPFQSFVISIIKYAKIRVGAEHGFTYRGWGGLWKTSLLCQLLCQVRRKAENVILELLFLCDGNLQDFDVDLGEATDFKKGVYSIELAEVTKGRIVRARVVSIQVVVYICLAKVEIVMLDFQVELFQLRELLDDIEGKRIAAIVLPGIGQLLDVTEKRVSGNKILDLGLTLFVSLLLSSLVSFLDRAEIHVINVEAIVLQEDCLDLVV